MCPLLHPNAKMISHLSKCFSIFAILLAPSVALYKGADMGWISEQEKSGHKFYNAKGVQTDPFVLLKSKGVNAVRLRVWVKPSGGWNDGADLLYKAKRAAAQGQAIMVDFHYSDSWADPGQQKVPADWGKHSLQQLFSDVYQHTTGILGYLKNNGITVTWVQVGNEINPGMLLPFGSTKNFTALAQLITSGYNGAKAIYPSAKVVLHLANAYDGSLFRWYFDNLKRAGAPWDIIGASHYPEPSNWQDRNAKAAANLKDMVSRYGKPVLVVEIGFSVGQPALAKQMIVDLKGRLSSLGSNFVGIFYWEPLALPGWQGYQLGATDSSGKLTAAMDF